MAVEDTSYLNPDLTPTESNIRKKTGKTRARTSHGQWWTAMDCHGFLDDWASPKKIIIILHNECGYSSTWHRDF